MSETPVAGGTGTPTDELRKLVESVAADVHRAWMQTKLAQGITSRPSADGIEQMVEYDELPDHLQELDRATVRAVFASPTLAARLTPPADAVPVVADTLREWATPDDDLGWVGSVEVHRHADEVASFLADRALLAER